MPWAKATRQKFKDKRTKGAVFSPLWWAYLCPLAVSFSHQRRDEGRSLAFWRCYYHVVWATKNREPLISPEIEAVIIQSAMEKSQALSSPIEAINTVADHVHIAACIPPKLAVAEWVRNIKGITAHEVNEMFPDLPSRFRWQRGYGVLTFGAKLLPIVTEYIAQQKEHHANDTLQPYLERIEVD